jgi:release factor glutamine methyltransferase
MLLYTQYERVPTESQLAGFRELVRRRSENVPVAYLIARAWFYALEFAVTPDVLIPRPDTETLVEQVITKVRQTPGWEAPAILDLCTGSGCVAIALARNLPTAALIATDISVKALEVAQQNAKSHNLTERITFFQGDLFEPAVARGEVPPRKFHIIASNPPYIPSGDIAALAPTVRDHEPRGALDGGPDGMTFHRRIIADARAFLEDKGLLILEIQFDQAADVQGLMGAAGYLENIRMIRDAGGNPRCVMGNAI